MTAGGSSCFSHRAHGRSISKCAHRALEAVQKCVSTVGLKVCVEMGSLGHTESQIKKFLTWENLKLILCGVAEVAGLCLVLLSDTSLPSSC